PFHLTMPTPTSLYTLSLHDALPICSAKRFHRILQGSFHAWGARQFSRDSSRSWAIEHRRRVLGARRWVCRFVVDGTAAVRGCRIDRKSTRLNSSHLGISYAVFCLKK